MFIIKASKMVPFPAFWLLMVFVVFSDVKASGHGQWSYSGNTGPAHWCELVHSCCGERQQSPVNLKRDIGAVNYPPLLFTNYEKIPKKLKMENNGHSVSIVIDDPSVNPTVSGGSLIGTYKFASFHFHWGSDDTKGSEHTIDGVAEPLELHMIHYNSKFADLNEAIQSNEINALAVLGIFYEIGETNRAMEKLTSHFKDVGYMGDSIILRKPFSLKSLLPAKTNFFFSYNGSLTTPTCNEIVAWTVFFDKQCISSKQMTAFRELKASTAGEPPVAMVNNYRPVQKYHGEYLNGVVA